MLVEVLRGAASSLLALPVSRLDYGMYQYLIGLCYYTPSSLRYVFVIVQLWNVTEVMNEVAVMIVTVLFIYNFCLKNN
jgi:hypothetical protein